LVGVSLEELDLDSIGISIGIELNDPSYSPNKRGTVRVHIFLLDEDGIEQVVFLSKWLFGR